MRFKANYLVIPLMTIVTAVIGGWITSQGMGWYRTLNLPSWVPSGGFIGAVWTTLFILATISALIAYNKSWGQRKKYIAGAFLANAVLNVCWSMLFFGLHLIGPAIGEAALLGTSVIVLIIFVWPISKFAAWLLVPYLGWVAFATWLTGVIGRLNT